MLRWAILLIAMNNIFSSSNSREQLLDYFTKRTGPLMTATPFSKFSHTNC